MEQEQKIENFSVIKQKIIKTDQLIDLYNKRTNSLKKLTMFCKELQGNHDENLRKLNRFELENERLVYTMNQLRHKLDKLEEENKNLLNNKLVLEHDFNKQVVDNMQTIKDLQDELKLLQDINSAAETLNCNEIIQKTEVSSNEKSKKIRNKEVDKLRTSIKMEYTEQISELQNESKYLTDKIDEIGQKNKEYIKEIEELKKQVKKLHSEEKNNTNKTILINQEEMNYLKQEVKSLKEANARLLVIQKENEMLKHQIGKNESELQEVKERNNQIFIQVTAKLESAKKENEMLKREIDKKEQELKEIKVLQTVNIQRTNVEVQTTFERINIEEDSQYTDCFPSLSNLNSLPDIHSDNSSLEIEDILFEMRMYPKILSPFSITPSTDLEELPSQVPEIIVTPSTPTYKDSFPTFSQAKSDTRETEQENFLNSKIMPSATPVENTEIELEIPEMLSINSEISTEEKLDHTKHMNYVLIDNIQSVCLIRNKESKLAIKEILDIPSEISNEEKLNLSKPKNYGINDNIESVYSIEKESDLPSDILNHSKSKESLIDNIKSVYSIENEKSAIPSEISIEEKLNYSKSNQNFAVENIKSMYSKENKESDMPSEISHEEKLKHSKFKDSVDSKEFNDVEIEVSEQEITEMLDSSSKICDDEKVDHLKGNNSINHTPETKNENDNIVNKLSRNPRKFKYRAPLKYEHFIKRRVICKKKILNKNSYSKWMEEDSKQHKTNLIIRALKTLQDSNINLTMSFPTAMDPSNISKVDHQFLLPTNVSSIKKLAEDLMSLTKDYENSTTNKHESAKSNISNLRTCNDETKHVEICRDAQSQEISDSMLDKIAELVSKKLLNSKSSKRKRPRTKPISNYSDSLNSVTEPEIANLFPKKSKNILERNKMLLKAAKLQNMRYFSESGVEDFDASSCSTFESSKNKTPVKNGDAKHVDMDSNSCGSFKMSNCPAMLSPMSSISGSPGKIGVQNGLAKPVRDDYSSTELSGITLLSSLNSSLDSCMSLVHLIDGESKLHDFFTKIPEPVQSEAGSNMDNFLPKTDNSDYDLLNKFESNNSPHSIDSGIESKCSPENVLQNDSAEESIDVLESCIDSSTNVSTKDDKDHTKTSFMNILNESGNQLTYDDGFKGFPANSLQIHEDRTLLKHLAFLNDSLTKKLKEVKVNETVDPYILSDIRNVNNEVENQKLAAPSTVQKFSNCPLSPDVSESYVKIVPKCIPLERYSNVSLISDDVNSCSNMNTKLNDTVSIDKDNVMTDEIKNFVQEFSGYESEVKSSILRSDKKTKTTNVNNIDCNVEDTSTDLKKFSVESNFSRRSKKQETLELNKNMRLEITARKVCSRTLRSRAKLNSIVKCVDSSDSGSKPQRYDLKEGNHKRAKECDNEIEESPKMKRANIQSHLETYGNVSENVEVQVEIKDNENPVINNSPKKRRSKNMTKIKSNVLRQMRQTSRMYKTEYNTVCNTAFSTLTSNPSSSSISTEKNYAYEDTASFKNSNFLENSKNGNGTINILQNVKLNTSADILKREPVDSPPNCKSPICYDKTSSPSIENNTNTKPKKENVQNSSNSGDILLQIMNEMDKDRPLTVTKPPTLRKKKNIPTSIEEKQWRLNILDIAEITHNEANLRDTFEHDVNIENAKATPLMKKKLSAKINILMQKFFKYTNEEKIPDDVILEFKRLDLDTITDVILHKLSEDIYEKPDASLYPAPMMTRTQRLFLRLMLRLEQEKVENVIDAVLNKIEILLFKIGSNLKSLCPITRLFLAVCRLRGDINRIRTFCCLAFLYMGDLAVPLFFTVLTSWIDILPMATDWQRYPMSKILVQMVHLKGCNMKGFNLVPLRQLLHQHYGYPREMWNSDEMFEELTQKYLCDPSQATEIAIRLLCKHKETRWVYQKINEFFKPLIYKIPSKNVNFKAQVIILLGKLGRCFKPKMLYDKNCLLELKQFLSGLADEDNVHDLIKRSVDFSMNRLEKIVRYQKNKSAKKKSKQDNCKKFTNRKKRKFNKTVKKS